MTEQARDAGKWHQGSEYEVSKEVVLSATEFQKFGRNLLDDQDWIGPGECGPVGRNKYRCIRVINKATGERILVNSEGFDYPRYTAIER